MGINLNLLKCARPVRNVKNIIIVSLHLIKIKTILYCINFMLYKYNVLNKNYSYILNYIVLNINFKRNKFFPFIKKDNEMDTIINSSLGMIANFFSKKKYFLKSKTAYVLLASFLRKILIYSNFYKIVLKVQKKPIYLIEIIK